MPEIERTPGKVNAYLIPTDVAVKESRGSHQAWPDSNPNTKGQNKTFCLWFRKNAPFARSGDYGTKWSEYRLKGEASTDAMILSQTETGGAGGFGCGSVAAGGSGDGSFKAVVEIARQMVSKAAGVSPDAVKITVAFG